MRADWVQAGLVEKVRVVFMWTLYKGKSSAPGPTTLQFIYYPYPHHIARHKVECAQSELVNGRDLVVAKAPNKGGVGLVFRFCSHTSVALVACHLASDVGAISMASRRRR